MKKSLRMRVICICALIFIMLAVLVVALSKKDDDNELNNEEMFTKVQDDVVIENLPWKNGGKQPSEYTYEEFESLEAGQQMAFQKSFGDIEEFEEWLQKVSPDEMKQEYSYDDLYIPWEDGGKKPSEYTYEEYEELEAGQQIEFQKSFDEFEEFEEWLQKVYPQ